MRPKAVGSYTATQVDRAVAGLDLEPTYRVRVEVLNKYLEVVRQLGTSSLILQGSRVYHNALTDIRRACELNIREVNITLSAYGTLIAAMAPLGFWELGETSGNFADSSGNSRTLTTHATITYSVASLLPGYATNNAIKPNGSTGFADIASASWMNVTRITVCGWWSGSGTNQALIDRDDGSSNRFWRLEIDGSGFVAFTIKFTAGSPNPQTYTASLAAVNDGKPHFICAVYDGSYVTIEVDGVILLRTAETRTMSTTGTCALRLCATNASTHFSSGTHDEWAIFGRALSAAERRQAYQAGTGDFSEIDYTRDLIKVYMGIGMVAGPDVNNDSQWAEYPLIVAKPSVPDRNADEYNIVRKVIGQDLALVLKNAKFSTRWTVAGGVNYITGANGILAIAQGAGLDTSGWSVTTTSLTVGTSIDWKIGDSYLDAINYMLSAIAYKPLVFRGTGQAVIEPIVLPVNRTIEDTLSTDSNSIIAPEIVDSIDLSQAYNQVTYYRSNPDGSSFIVSTQTNTNWDSPTCVQKIGYNPAPPIQLDSGDSNSLITGAQNALASFAQIPSQLKLKTLARPFEDNEDCYQINLTGTSPTLNVSGKYVETEWNLPLDADSGGSLMEHTFRQAIATS